MGISCFEEKVKKAQISDEEKLKNNKKKLNCNFINIKSQYILQKIFNNLVTKIRLNIMKLNKKLKKRLNTNINDYKEYSESYSSIEIEIKPINNEYGRFINYKKKDEKYFHIYFNNNKKEIKRNHIN